MQPTLKRALLVFRLGGKLAALPLECVQAVAPMADLAHPPALPACLEGILNLAGEAVPVLRLAGLLQLPLHRPGLYSMLVLVKVAGHQLAVLVDRVEEVLQVAESSLMQVAPQDSFNGCATALVTVRDQAAHLLSPEQLLLAKERESLSAFMLVEQRRLDDWIPAAQ